MNTWKHGRQVSVTLADKHMDDRVAWTISIHEGDDVGYSDHSVDVRFIKDGAISFSDGSGFIYLYPSQVKKLRGLIRNIPQPPIPKFVPRKLNKP